MYLDLFYQYQVTFFEIWLTFMLIGIYLILLSYKYKEIEEIGEEI